MRERKEKQQKQPKERKLSKAELKRKEEFDKLTETLMAQGYQPNHITMSVLDANVWAIAIELPIVVPFLILFYSRGYEISLHFSKAWVAYVLFLILIVVHELIHGITWSLFVENGWKSISFGFIVEYLTPYCSCNQPMKKYQIIIGSMMPTLLLGILPGIVALYTGSSTWMLVAVLMIFGGGGDMLVICKLLRYKTGEKEVLFMDHPYEVGTAVFEKNV